MNESGVIAWFARNHVAANLLMLFVVVSGLLATLRIRKEVFPDIDVNAITITVEYPGASPAEVEQAICVRVEEEIHSLEGIEKITSNASEGIASILVELLEGADENRLLDDVKSRVDAIDTFPVDAEEPVVRDVALRRQVINVAVSGELDERSLKLLGERVRDDIVALPGITQAELRTVRPFEVSIEVAEDALRRHRLTFDDVAAAVRQSSLDLPGGSVKTEAGEILLRTKGQAYVGDEFEDIVVVRRPDGTRVRVGDVATVHDGFADTDQSSRFDGRRAALIQVFRVGDQDALAIVAAVKTYVETARAALPDGVELTTWRNEAKELQGRQELLLRNGLQGFLLVFGVLALFLRFELALWVCIGIPISFLGTLWLMPLLGVSINMLSLFAFILVLGIVVDDAIVVGENVDRHVRGGSGGLDAAVRGTLEVSVPVTFGVLTTMAAFIPMLNVPGSVGKFWAIIPLVVLPTLAFSLIESKLVLPTHLRNLRHDVDARGLARAWSRFQGLFARGLERFVERTYRPVLRAAIERRYLTVAVAIAVCALTVGLVGGGHVRFVFFPPVDGNNVVASLTMPEGTSAEHTARAVGQIERAALALRDELAREHGAEGNPFEHVLATIGEQPFRQLQSQNGGRFSTQSFAASNVAEVDIQLAPSEARTVTSVAIADRWRELTGPVFGATELKFTSSLITIGDDIDIRLAGDDVGALRAAAARLRHELRSYSAVSDVADSFRPGKLELQLAIRESAEALGLSQVDLARQVRQGFHGEEAQRIQRGRDDVRVMVRYPADRRRSLTDVEHMRIRTPDGDEVPFDTVADAVLERGFASIQRTDRQRTVSVTAEVDESVSDVDSIVRELEAGVLPRLMAEFPGLRYSVEGERREQARTLEGLGSGFLIALMMIYALLAIPFRSYVQPLIVMAVIPFGVVGAVLGHLLMGLELSVLSLCGIVALSGVVVNDSLVLVDFVNRRRRAGATVHEAILVAGMARFRPILLTSLTTFAGLTPLLLERSVQAAFLIPMAVSLAFGILFSTVLTLLLVPTAYTVLEDVRRLGRWFVH